MKKLAMFMTLLALLLTQIACAEPSDALKGVYDALLSENSAYSQAKAIYAEYSPDMVYEESLRDDGFTIAVSGSEFMDGSWNFTQDGDYLTITLPVDDYSGFSLVTNVINAVGTYYGMDTALLNGYTNGLIIKDIENDYFTMTEDEAAGTNSVRINIAGPWDMKELSEMVLDEAILDYGPLSGEHTSIASSIGKLMMIANGTADDATILIGEYGELDELAFQSIVNVVSILKPNGYEDFIANYTELAEVEEKGYSVKLDVDDATVGEIIDDARDTYSYAVMRFGEQANAGEP